MCPLLHTNTQRACPTVLPCDEQLLPESLFGREDSCFLHHRLSGYAHAVWEGARRLGVWDARPGSAQRSLWVWERYGESVPLLLSRRTIGPKEPRRCRRGYRLLIGDTDEELPDMVGRLT